jgi:hypothetical protein
VVNIAAPPVASSTNNLITRDFKEFLTIDDSQIGMRTFYPLVTYHLNMSHHFDDISLAAEQTWTSATFSYSENFIYNSDEVK